MKRNQSCVALAVSSNLSTPTAERLATIQRATRGRGAGGEGCSQRKWLGHFLLLSLAAAPFMVLAADTPKPQEKLTAEERIAKALDEPTELPDFIETPLRDVIDYLKDHHKIEIQIDKKALDEVAISTDHPITKNLRGISLKAALRLTLRELDLCYLVQDEVLLITTPEEADARLTTKVYDVVDLVTPAPPEGADAKVAPFAAKADFDMLVAAITSCAAPTTWDAVGGPGSIAPFEAAGIRALVVSQTQAVHEQVEMLLKNLRAARHGKSSTEFVPKPLAKPSDAERDASRGKYEKEDERRAAIETKLRKALDERLSVEFQDAPLKDVIAFLIDKSKLPIQLEKRVMDDAGIADDAPITFTSKDRQLRHILDGLLKPIELTWIVQDEVILVTTPEMAEERMTTRVYDVADLPAFRDKDGKTVPDYEGLSNTLRSTVAPTTWDDAGGRGSIKPFNNGGVQAVVVLQTQRVHERIVDVLANLRKVRKAPLTKEELEKLPPVPPPKPAVFNGSFSLRVDSPTSRSCSRS